MNQFMSPIGYAFLISQIYYWSISQDTEKGNKVNVLEVVVAVAVKLKIKRNQVKSEKIRQLFD